MSTFLKVLWYGIIFRKWVVFWKICDIILFSGNESCFEILWFGLILRKWVVFWSFVIRSSFKEMSGVSKDPEPKYIADSIKTTDPLLYIYTRN